MSKFKGVFLSFLFALFLTQIISVLSIGNVVLAEEIVYGDINGDQKVDSIDFALMRQHILGIIKEFDNANGIKAADVDGNGVFNSIDFAFMRKYLLGFIDVFPVNQGLTPTPTPSSASEFTKLKPSIVDVKMDNSNRNTIELSWSKIEGAASYEVFRDEVSIGITENNSLTDADVLEGVNHKYRINAVNAIGESSLKSSEVIVNTIDAFINIDTAFEEDRFYMNLSIEDGAKIDLNGHTLNVKGDFLQFEGIVNINSGNLKVGWDYVIYEEGLLQMTNEGDYVFVEGDFMTLSRYDFYNNGTEPLSAGVMEVKGNFSSAGYKSSSTPKGNFGCYPATGSHKVIFSGNQEQVIYYDGWWLEFNELEIKNEAGIKFDSLIPGIKKMKGHYKINGELLIGYFNPQIIGDIVIDGDLRIKDIELDLSGYNLKVNGVLTQISEYETSIVNINGGSLLVCGNYIMGPELDNQKCYSKLKMTNEKDYVYVGGDFITSSGNNNFEIIDNNLTSGVMEVKGDFWCKGRDSNYFGRYVAKGSHKVILSGDEEQVVYNDSGWLVFNELEIKNETVVRFDSTTAIVRISNMSNDVTINGDLSIVNQEFDLNGYSLIITGDFNQFSTYGPSLLKVNGGSLRVNGDYNVGYDNLNNQFESINDPGSVLQMTNESDYVYVGGNFTTCSEVDHSEYLTAGTLEVKGDFTQSNNPLNLAASGTHKTILSGETVQTITFESPTTSSFNILQLTKPLDTGYIFNTTPVWRIIEN